MLRFFCRSPPNELSRLPFARQFSSKLEITSPYSGETLGSVDHDTKSSIKSKVQGAWHAQKHWSEVPFEKRAAVLEKFGEIIKRDSEELAKVMSSEVGKPISQARGEIAAVDQRVEFFVKHAKQVMADEEIRQAGNLRERITLEPLGVVAHISAWNYPYFVGTNVLLPALLTGNAVVYKPSEYATLTGLNIAKCFYEAGLPKDLLSVVVGKGDVGMELLSNNEPQDFPKPRISAVYFTGSKATGEKIAAVASKQHMRVHSELGGKDPVYVCEDVDIDAVVASLVDGAFYNTGQSCCSVERIYVHSSIYSTFVEKYAAKASSLRLGDPCKEDTYIGPLTRPEQIAVLEAQVADATQKGAKVLTGGSGTSVNGRGGFFLPTVLSNVDHSMLVMREESFGPIIGIQSVQDDADALQLMDDTGYGLTAGVYSKNEERAKRILSQIQAGTVYWNCCDRVSPYLPWSGRRGSGTGEALSKYGIKSFLTPKAWHLVAP